MKPFPLLRGDPTGCIPPLLPPALLAVTLMMDGEVGGLLPLYCRPGVDDDNVRKVEAAASSSSSSPTVRLAAPALAECFACDRPPPAAAAPVDGSEYPGGTVAADAAGCEVVTAAARGWMPVVLIDILPPSSVAAAMSLSGCALVRSCRWFRGGNNSRLGSCCSIVES